MEFTNLESISKEKSVTHLKEKCPELLLQNEQVNLAFKAGRDKYYFTSLRIIIEDKQGLSGKRIEYKSCPYHTIKAFLVKTPISLETDVKFKIFGESLDLTIGFDRNKTSIFDIQTFLNGKVFGDSIIHDSLDYNDHSPQSPAKNGDDIKYNKINDYLSGDSLRLEENEVENELRNIGTILSNEKVNLAYKCARELLIFTSKRMLHIENNESSEKTLECLSMRYSSIKAYKVDNDGVVFNRDDTLQIFTNICQEKTCITTELRKDQPDIMEVLWHLNNQMLGVDTVAMEQFVLSAMQSRRKASSMKSWLGDEDDISQLDVSQVNLLFHVSPPLLQSDEVCEMVLNDSKDLILLTTKRILVIDKQG